MKVAIFLETKNNKLLSVGLELIGKTIDMMGDKEYKLDGIVVTSQANAEFESNIQPVNEYLDEIFIYEYQADYLSTEHYQKAVCNYVAKEKPNILLLGATGLGRSFGPRVAACFKTGITADCTEIKYDAADGLVQIRPAFGEEILAEIITPDHLPQMATVRPGIMDPPDQSGNKQAKLTWLKEKLDYPKLTIIDRKENKQDLGLAKAKIVVLAGNAIKEKEELDLVKKLAKALDGDYGVTRPLVAGGLAAHNRQVGVSGTILAANIALLLGVSGSNQTLAGIEKAKKIIAVNNDPQANIFNKADIGIVDDWKSFTINLLKQKEKMKNEKD